MRNITELSDVRFGTPCDDGRVLIKIWIDEPSPPRGRTETEEGEERPFAGWLQLLAMLNELLEQPEN